jgi:hypothetical protein
MALCSCLHSASYAFDHFSLLFLVSEWQKVRIEIKKFSIRDSIFLFAWLGGAALISPLLN